MGPIPNTQGTRSRLDLKHHGETTVSTSVQKVKGSQYCPKPLRTFEKQRGGSFHTWSKERQVEDEADQDDPGVGGGAVVVGPDGTVRQLRLVGTSGA